MRFVKVETVINGDDGGTWVNADNVTAIVDFEDSVLVATTGGVYRSKSQDAIDILNGMDMIVNEATGVAVSGLETATKARRAERGVV